MDCEPEIIENVYEDMKGMDLEEMEGYAQKLRNECDEFSNMMLHGDGGYQEEWKEKMAKACVAEDIYELMKKHEEIKEKSEELGLEELYNPPEEFSI